MKIIRIFDGNMATVKAMSIWKSTEVLRDEEDDVSVPRIPPRSFRSAAPPEKGTKERINKV
jgi:hypothetical protein